MPRNPFVCEVEQELKAVPLQERHRMTVRWEEAMASLKMRKGNICVPKVPSLPERSAYGIRENATSPPPHTGCRWITARSSTRRTAGKLRCPERSHDPHSSEYGGKDPEKFYQRTFNELMNETVFKTEKLSWSVKFRLTQPLERQSVSCVSSEPSSHVKRTAGRAAPDRPVGSLGI
jgi:hypothetical protein